MAYYKYSAISKNGVKVNKIAFSHDQDSLLQQLHSEAFDVLTIKETKPMMSKTVALTELLEICEKISTLLESGFQLNTALEFVRKNSKNLHIQEVFYNIDNDVKEGMSFADSLAEYPKIFDLVFINMVRVGEKNGILAQVMKDMNNYLEERDNFNKKIKGALTYPAVMVFVLIITMVIMFFFILPHFAKMFGDMGAKLPSITKFTLDLSSSLRHHWFIIFAPTVLCGILLRFFFKTRFFLSFWNKNIIRFPVIGGFVIKSNLLSFTRVMRLSLDKGMEFVEAFNGAKNVMKNEFIKDIFSGIYNEIKMGTRIGTAFSEYEIFPDMFKEMIKLGDETGSLPLVLGKVESSYEKEISRRIEGFLGLIEPLMTLVMGLIVGGVAASIMIPMFNLSNMAGG